MKIHRHLGNCGTLFAWPSEARRLCLVGAVVLATNLPGQLQTPMVETKTTPAVKEDSLAEKVRAELPRYKETPAPVAAPKPVVENPAEIIQLAPLVVTGQKRIKLNESDLWTQKALSAAILKEYDYSAFSLFQYKEDVRLQEMAGLRTYAENLQQAGDVEGSRAIKRESSRLFLRQHDAESESIDSFLNPRVR